MLKMEKSLTFLSLLIALAMGINIVKSYPYNHQEILNIPAFEFGKEQNYNEKSSVAYSKHFHFFTAPEEPETYDDIIPEYQKNIRVVVIKAPENNRLISAVSRLATSLAEEKTAIYVLNKEPDLADLTAQVNKFKDGTHQRPEVHFVKYKTSDEAQNAAINIQSQYDYLNGPSKHASGGEVPTSNLFPPFNNEPTDLQKPLDSRKSTQSEGSVGKVILSLGVPPTASEKIVNTTLDSSVSKNPTIIGYYLPPGTSKSSIDLRMHKSDLNS